MVIGSPAVATMRAAAGEATRVIGRDVNVSVLARGE
jgi:hypothetical protein